MNPDQALSEKEELLGIPTGDDPLAQFGLKSITDGLLGPLGGLVPALSDVASATPEPVAEPEQPKPAETPAIVQQLEKTVLDQLAVVRKFVSYGDSILIAQELSSPGSTDLNRVKHQGAIEAIKALRVLRNSIQEQKLKMPKLPGSEELAKAYDTVAQNIKDGVPQKKQASMKDMSDVQRRVSMGMMLGALLSGRGKDIPSIAGTAYKLQQEINDTQYANDVARQKAEQEAAEYTIKAAGLRDADLKALYQGDWAEWKTTMDRLTAGEADIAKLGMGIEGANNQQVMSLLNPLLAQITGKDKHYETIEKSFLKTFEQKDTTMGASTRRANLLALEREARARAEDPMTGAMMIPAWRGLADRIAEHREQIVPSAWEGEIVARTRSATATAALRNAETELRALDKKFYNVKLTADLGRVNAQAAAYRQSAATAAALVKSRNAAGQLDRDKFTWQKASARLGTFYKTLESEKKDLVTRQTSLQNSLTQLEKALLEFMPGPRKDEVENVTIPAIKQELFGIMQRMGQIDTALQNKGRADLDFDDGIAGIEEVLSGFDLSDAPDAAGGMADALQGLTDAANQIAPPQQVYYQPPYIPQVAPGVQPNPKGNAPDAGLTAQLMNTTEANRKKNFVVHQVQALSGIPYVFGGSDLKKGLDCSGLVCEFFGLPRDSALGLFKKLPKVVGPPQPGDVLFFKGTDPKRPNLAVTHTGIFVGTDPKGKQWMFHSSRKGVPSGMVPLDNYYKQRLVGAGRTEFATSKKPQK